MPYKKALSYPLMLCPALLISADIFNYVMYSLPFSKERLIVNFINALVFYIASLFGRIKEEITLDLAKCLEQLLKCFELMYFPYGDVLSYV